MTRIIFFRSGGSIFGFEAKGHTGYAEEGSDIVCSAVSALTQSAALGLTEYLKLPTELKIKDGHMVCMLIGSMDEALRGKADAILETLLLGLKGIALTSSEYIDISEREV